MINTDEGFDLSLINYRGREERRVNGWAEYRALLLNNLDNVLTPQQRDRLKRLSQILQISSEDLEQDITAAVRVREAMTAIKSIDWEKLRTHHATAVEEYKEAKVVAERLVEQARLQLCQTQNAVCLADAENTRLRSVIRSIRECNARLFGGDN